jgi:hypothetical protein
MPIYPTESDIKAALESYAVPQKALIELKKFQHLNKPPMSYGHLKTLAIAIWQAERPTSPPPTVHQSTLYAFNPSLGALYLDQWHPSIISTLHELGHALNGPSELQACLFSVGLFKAAYPRAYARLVFKGHMLVKP